MQISKKAEYSLHAMIYIASTEGGRKCSINEISENMGIPREYLAKVLKHLTNERYLVSSRGIKGGYRLAKAPEKISFLDILETAQGPFKINTCGSKECCPAFSYWENLQKYLKTTLSDMNLGKLDYKKHYAKGRR
jgi:Rrf2 family protein